MKAPAPVEGPTVYYDGSCPLCSVEIAHYERQQGAEGIRFVDASQPGASLGSDLDAGDAMARFHVRRADGSLVSGARGVVEIWGTLPRWKWAAWIARLPGVTPMLEGGYRLFLPLRPKLSRIAARLGAKARNSG